MNRAVTMRRTGKNDRHTTPPAKWPGGLVAYGVAIAALLDGADWLLRGATAAEDAPQELDALTGPILTEVDAAELFALVETVADRMSLSPPRELRLGYLPACSVIRQRGRDVLLVGLGCLQTLTVEQLGAVLAHELAHLQLDSSAGRYLLARARRWSRRAKRNDSQNVRYRLALAAHRLLGRPAARLERSFEVRADRAAAGLLGDRPLRQALRTLAVADPIFREALYTFDPTQPDHDTVFDLFEFALGNIDRNGFRALITSRLQAADQEAEQGDLGHPPLRDRLATLAEDRIGSAPLDVRAARRSALELIHNVAEYKRALHHRLFDNPRRGESVFRPARP